MVPDDQNDDDGSKEQCDKDPGQNTKERCELNWNGCISILKIHISYYTKS